MRSISKTLGGSKKKSGANLLKGSDLPVKQQNIDIEVTEVRDAPPGFGSPYILEIKCELPEKTAFPLNKTNLGIIGQQIGDDLDVIAGGSIRLHKALVNNPQTDEMTFGLVVDIVTLPKKAATKKAKKA